MFPLSSRELLRSRSHRKALDCVRSTIGVSQGLVVRGNGGSTVRDIPEEPIDVDFGVTDVIQSRQLNQPRPGSWATKSKEEVAGIDKWTLTLSPSNINLPSLST